MERDAHNRRIREHQELFLQVITKAAFARDCGVFDAKFADSWLINTPNMLTPEEDMSLPGPRMAAAIAAGRKMVRELGCGYWKDNPDVVVAIREMYGE